MSDLPVYQDQNRSFEERARDLVSRMSVGEKVSQMLHDSPAIDRLGIPSYNWWGEALHGVARAGVSTMFPQAIGMAATFDEDMVYREACIISTEGRAKYHEFQRQGDHDIFKGLTFWSPNINIFRDPRWGRGQETYGEDPFLTGRLGMAFIKGIQGDHPRYLKAAACAKHYAVHSGPEAGRHEFNAVVSKKDLRETYLPAFKECVQEAGVESVMGAYNRTNGEPCCGSKTLLEDILRQEWGFRGHVTSDCWAIKDFHEGHRVTRNAAESVALALKNGCDLNCGCLYSQLTVAYQEGLVTEEMLDRALVRLFVTRMKLGMFDDPADVPYAGIGYEENDSKAHNAFALEMSKRSLVLLKNENNLLPLDKKKLKSIAVIGPNANSRAALMGNYHGAASRYTTVLEGIQDHVGEDVRVYYAEGCHLYRDRLQVLAKPRDGFSEAVAAAQKADVSVVCLGLDEFVEGEEGDTSNEYSSGDKLNLNLPGVQQDLLEAVCNTGKPVILILLSGSALAVSWADEHVPAILQAFYPGAQGGKAIASLLFGEYSPSGRLPVTFYRTAEELPDFLDYAMQGRTYRYMKNEALYPFGFGLGYAEFEYDDLQLGSEKYAVGETVQCSVTVKNTGRYAGSEVVQLYLQDMEASVDVPKWRLAGIRNIFLKPGAKAKAVFTLTPRLLALINDDGKCVLESGMFRVYVGGSQPDSRSVKLTGRKPLEITFELTGQATELKY